MYTITLLCCAALSTCSAQTGLPKHLRLIKSPAFVVKVALGGHIVLDNHKKWLLSRYQRHLRRLRACELRKHPNTATVTLGNHIPHANLRAFRPKKPIPIAHPPRELPPQLCPTPLRKHPPPHLSQPPPHRLRKSARPSWIPFVAHPAH